MGAGGIWLPNYKRPQNLAPKTKIIIIVSLFIDDSLVAALGPCQNKSNSGLINNFIL